MISTSWLSHDTRTDSFISWFLFKSGSFPAPSDLTDISSDCLKVLLLLSSIIALTLSIPCLLMSLIHATGKKHFPLMTASISPETKSVFPSFFNLSLTSSSFAAAFSATSTTGPVTTADIPNALTLSSKGFPGETHNLISTGLQPFLLLSANSCATYLVILLFLVLNNTLSLESGYFLGRLTMNVSPLLYLPPLENELSLSISNTSCGYISLNALNVTLPLTLLIT